MKKQFKGLMSRKNESEYQPTLMNAKDSDDAILRAERIVSKAKSMIKK